MKAEAFNLKGDGEKSIVAVKMLKERADMSQRKALLAELKILIHVGHHLNILNLLGAVTKDFMCGDFLVIIEYCANGNMRSFLLAHRSAFINQLNSSTGEVDFRINQNFNDDHKYVNDVNATRNYQNFDLVKGGISLRLSRKVTTSDLISYTFQCAKGMEYLSSKKVSISFYFLNYE